MTTLNRQETNSLVKQVQVNESIIAFYRQKLEIVNKTPQPPNVVRHNTYI